MKLLKMEGIFNIMYPDSGTISSKLCCSSILKVYVIFFNLTYLGVMSGD
jgi:hypothetical protein